MSMKHTKEPWKVDAMGRIIMSENRGKVYQDIAEIRPGILLAAVDKANAARIVSCVNALAGVKNPGEAMELVRDVLGGLVKRNKTVLGDAIGHSTLDEIHKALAALGETSGASDES